MTALIASAEAGGCLGGLLPNLQTVVPKHLQIQNEHQREIPRFTNGIANRGPGPWRMRPEPPPGSDTLVTNAIQEILDADGDKVWEKIVSTCEFHPELRRTGLGVPLTTRRVKVIGSPRA